MKIFKHVARYRNVVDEIKKDCIIIINLTYDVNDDVIYSG